jgi:flavin reductase like protein
MAVAAAAQPAPALDARSFRGALGRFATGVAFVTAAPDGEPAGLIVNSLTSVSLDPPLVSFCPSRSSLTWQRMRRTGRFGVNVLGHEHERFAIRATPAGADRFAGLDWELGRGRRTAPHRRPRQPRVRARRRAPRRRPLDRPRSGRLPAHHADQKPARLLRRRVRRPATAKARPRARHSTLTCPGTPKHYRSRRGRRRAASCGVRTATATDRRSGMRTSGACAATGLDWSPQTGRPKPPNPPRPARRRAINSQIRRRRRERREPSQSAFRFVSSSA